MLEKYDVPLDLNLKTPMKLINDRIKKNSTVLEFGPANGRLTKYLKECKNCTVDIVEYNDISGKDAAQFARNAFIGKDEGDIEKYIWVKKLKGEKYDCIIFADVLEHLYNPESALKNCKEFLKENGTILVSIPNIANNNIILNLLKDNFEYTSTGLLDDTHIRFFTYNSFNALCKKIGYVISYIDFSNGVVGETEIPIHYGMFNDYSTSIIKKHKYGDVYQFVYELRNSTDKNEFILENKLEEYDIFESYKPIGFYETNNQYKPEYVIFPNYIKKTNNYYTVMYDVSNVPINKIFRFDPIEDEFCEIKIISAKTSSGDLKIKSENSQYKYDNTYYFLNTDPIIEFYNECGIFQFVEIDYEMEILSQKDINSLVCRQKKDYEERIDMQKKDYEETKKHQNRKYDELLCKYNEISTQYNHLRNSKGVRVLFAVHNFKDRILPHGSRRRKIVKSVFHKFFNLVRKEKKVLNNSATDVHTFEYNVWDYKIRDRVVILTTQHCLFIANMISECLEKINILTAIITKKPDNGYENLPHIVICPQMFKELPALYVAYQLEQSVSSRWFNDEYFRVLKNAAAVFDYSINNIEYLQMNQIPFNKTYYVPIAPCGINYSKGEFVKEYKYDVLFYGDDSCNRRKEYLDVLKKKFKVKIINDLFGAELYEEISKAKIIVNIHYYSGALLETTRLSECLSIGRSIVISEKTDDMNEVREFANLVEFVDDYESMVNTINKYLSNENLFFEKIEKNQAYINNMKVSSFQYHFYRFLLATDNITFDKFYELSNDYINFKSNMWCLSLPETKYRMDSFKKDNYMDIEIFSGLRHYEGWIGCGISYKFLMKKASDMGLSSVVICEDDVLFTDRFKMYYNDIVEYLSKENTKWDLFSGLIADVHEETKILEISTYKDMELVAVDHMTSTVFNIYNKTIYDAFISWDYMFRDKNINTIDRFIEKEYRIKIYTTNPFLVFCKPDTGSTLWGFMNTQYDSYIERSTEVLRKKIDEFKENIQRSR